MNIMLTQSITEIRKRWSFRNTRRICVICSKLIIKARWHWRRSVVFIVNFEQIAQIFYATWNIILSVAALLVDMLREINKNSGYRT